MLYSGFLFFFHDLVFVALQHHRRFVLQVNLFLVVVFGIVGVLLRLSRGFRTANPSATRGGFAKTSHRFFPVPFKLVIDGNLFPRLNLSQRENADAQLAFYHPFLRLAVWIARVVQKPPNAASFRGIDSFRTRQSHEIKVPPLFPRVLPFSLLVRFLVQHLADVLQHELARFNILLREQPVSFLTRPFDL